MGGLSWPRGPSPYPSSVYTASLRKGFLGCFRDLSLDGSALDLVPFLSQPSALRQIEGGCEALSLEGTREVKGEWSPL